MQCAFQIRRQAKILRIVPILFFIFFLCACEKSVLQPETPSGNSEARNSLPKHVMARISFDEKTITSSTQWPRSAIGGLKKENSDEMNLISFANRKKIIEMDSAGRQNEDVAWIEGNADIRMPLDMWSEVKNKTNPIDPQANPMVRYTLVNGQYVAYGTNGAIIFSATFPQDTIPLLDTTLYPGSKINPKLRLVPITARNSNSVEDIVNKYRARGILCKSANSDVILTEQNVQTPKGKILTRAVVDTRSGLLQRSATYNVEGKLLNVVLFSYKDVNGYYYPATIVDYSMGLLSDGSWGILTKTVQARTNLTIETR